MSMERGKDLGQQNVHRLKHSRVVTKSLVLSTPGHLHASTPAVNGNSIEGTEAMMLMTGTGSYYAASPLFLVPFREHMTDNRDALLHRSHAVTRDGYGTIAFPNRVLEMQLPMFADLLYTVLSS